MLEWLMAVAFFAAEIFLAVLAVAVFAGPPD